LITKKKRRKGKGQQQQQCNKTKQTEKGQLMPSEKLEGVQPFMFARWITNHHINVIMCLIMSAGIFYLEISVLKPGFPCSWV